MGCPILYHHGAKGAFLYLAKSKNSKEVTTSALCAKCRQYSLEYISHASVLCIVAYPVSALPRRKSRPLEDLGNDWGGHMLRIICGLHVVALVARD